MLENLSRKAAASLVSAALVAGLCPAGALALEAPAQPEGAAVVAQAGDNIAEGTWGTCPWEISSDGTLTVHTGVGAEQPELASMSPWREHGDRIVKAVFESGDGGRVVAPACSGGLLAGLDKMESVDLSGLDTSRATTMYYMFKGCSSLKEADLTGLDMSKVTSMNMMFMGCAALESLDLSGLDASKVEDMAFAFSGCFSLKSINLDGLRTESLTHMYNTFSGCASLASLDLSGLDTSNVVDMRALCADCVSLKSLDLSGLDTSRATNMNYMFSNCASLESLDLSGFGTSEVEDMSSMLYGCTALKTVYAGEKWSTAALKYSGSMFDGCTSLVGGNGTSFDAARTDAEYARVDTEGAPGYFTFKAQAASQAMHRLYNQWTGEHFYTADVEEHDHLVEVGWTYEGVGWDAPQTSSTPVYRLYNRYVPGGDHHYTTDAAERDHLVDVGWTYEGVGWYSDDAKAVPLYRQYNPYAETGTHNYTKDKSENDHLVEVGWRAEGIGWYGV